MDYNKFVYYLNNIKIDAYIGNIIVENINTNLKSNIKKIYNVATEGLLAAATPPAGLILPPAVIPLPPAVLAADAAALAAETAAAAADAAATAADAAVLAATTNYNTIRNSPRPRGIAAAAARAARRLNLDAAHAALAAAQADAVAARAAATTAQANLAAAQAASAAARRAAGLP
jgi:hypothetical protein